MTDIERQQIMDEANSDATGSMKVVSLLVIFGAVVIGCIGMWIMFH